MQESTTNCSCEISKLFRNATLKGKWMVYSNKKEKENGYSKENLLLYLLVKLKYELLTSVINFQFKMLSWAKIQPKRINKNSF